MLDCFYTIILYSLMVKIWMLHASYLNLSVKCVNKLDLHIQSVPSFSSK